jgi:hypothetical protein
MDKWQGRPWRTAREERRPAMELQKAWRESNIWYLRVVS